MSIIFSTLGEFSCIPGRRLNDSSRDDSLPVDE